MYWTALLAQHTGAFSFVQAHGQYLKSVPYGAAVLTVSQAMNLSPLTEIAIFIIPILACYKSSTKCIIVSTEH